MSSSSQAILDPEVGIADTFGSSNNNSRPAVYSKSSTHAILVETGNDQNQLGIARDVDGGMTDKNCRMNNIDTESTTSFERAIEKEAITCLRRMAQERVQQNGGQLVYLMPNRGMHITITMTGTVLVTEKGEQDFQTQVDKERDQNLERKLEWKALDEVEGNFHVQAKGNGSKIALAETSSLEAEKVITTREVNEEGDLRNSDRNASEPSSFEKEALNSIGDYTSKATVFKVPPDENPIPDLFNMATEMKEEYKKRADHEPRCRMEQQNVTITMTRSILGSSGVGMKDPLALVITEGDKKFGEESELKFLGEKGEPVSAGKVGVKLETGRSANIASIVRDDFASEQNSNRRAYPETLDGNMPCDGEFLKYTDSNGACNTATSDGVEATNSVSTPEKCYYAEESFQNCVDENLGTRFWIYNGDEKREEDIAKERYPDPIDRANDMNMHSQTFSTEASYESDSEIEEEKVIPLRTMLDQASKSTLLFLEETKSGPRKKDLKTSKGGAKKLDVSSTRDKGREKWDTNEGLQEDNENENPKAISDEQESPRISFCSTRSIENKHYISVASASTDESDALGFEIPDAESCGVRSQENAEEDEDEESLEWFRIKSTKANDVTYNSIVDGYGPKNLVQGNERASAEIVSAGILRLGKTHANPPQYLEAIQNEQGQKYLNQAVLDRSNDTEEIFNTLIPNDMEAYGNSSITSSHGSALKEFYIEQKSECSSDLDILKSSPHEFQKMDSTGIDIDINETRHMSEETEKAEIIPLLDTAATRLKGEQANYHFDQDNEDNIETDPLTPVAVDATNSFNLKMTAKAAIPVGTILDRFSKSTLVVFDEMKKDFTPWKNWLKKPSPLHSFATLPSETIPDDSGKTDANKDFSEDATEQQPDRTLCNMPIDKKDDCDRCISETSDRQIPKADSESVDIDTCSVSNTPYEVVDIYSGQPMSIESKQSSSDEDETQEISENKDSCAQDDNVRDLAGASSNASSKMQSLYQTSKRALLLLEQMGFAPWKKDIQSWKKWVMSNTRIFRIPKSMYSEEEDDDDDTKDTEANEDIGQERSIIISNELDRFKKLLCSNRNLDKKHYMSMAATAAVIGVLGMFLTKKR